MTWLYIRIKIFTKDFLEIWMMISKSFSEMGPIAQWVFPHDEEISGFMVRNKAATRHCGIKDLGHVTIETIHLKTVSNWNLLNLIYLQLLCQLWNPYEILPRARQCDCRALCKIPEGSIDYNICYEQRRFKENTLKDALQTGSIYCHGPLVNVLCNRANCANRCRTKRKFCECT